MASSARDVCVVLVVGWGGHPTNINNSSARAVVHAAGLGWGFLGNFLLFLPLSGIQLNID